MKVYSVWHGDRELGLYASHDELAARMEAQSDFGINESKLDARHPSQNVETAEPSNG